MLIHLPISVCGESRQSPKQKHSRRGAALVEMAFVLPVFIVLVLGMLDLGIAVFRSHILAHAAPEGSRRAIVHGSLSSETWGPTAFEGTADGDGHPLIPLIRPSLVGLDLSQVTVRIEWPEGSNALQKPVRVTLTMPYHPAMTFIFGNPTFTLQGTSTMRIVH